MAGSVMHGALAATILAFLLSFALSTDVPIPSNSADLDRWIAVNTMAFNARTTEIASGIDTKLEPRLLAAENKRRVITVNQDGKGDFKTVTDAVKSIPAGNSHRTIIKIGPGVYKEKVLVDRSRPFITFYGEPDAIPTITFDGTAAKYGTIYSATVAVESHFFMAVNIIFENTAPEPAPGAQGGQAVAMRISGDKAAFYNCKFYGYQDTLCDDIGRHFFQDCFIQGTVDFIFGNGRSIYKNCELHSVGKGAIAITAQARNSVADKSGFSFLHCKVTGTGNVYLSRAWKQSSRVVFAYSYLDNLVNPKGWDDKGYLDRHQTVFYGEYKCMGPGSSTSQRASFGKVLNDAQAKPFISMTFIRAATWLLPHPTL
ncbi:putative pectinesterase 63 [Magnolia sinica]|uniref:putative pectinesterase 63 n=1 Tax=Magnolia sinica TaxID=86752 RepID=UPI002658A64A|nr:putative pectinesterase 63 [Magnolia sinica]